MPGGCTLLFEPFVATQEHEDTFDGVVAGNIYGQSTESVDMGDGTCKRLLARPIPGPDDGNIRAMSCTCPDESVITADPIPNDRGDMVWQEQGFPLANCNVSHFAEVTPAFVTTHYPCSITNVETGETAYLLRKRGSWPSAPFHVASFLACWATQYAARVEYTWRNSPHRFWRLMEAFESALRGQVVSLPMSTPWTHPNHVATGFLRIFPRNFVGLAARLHELMDATTQNPMVLPVLMNGEETGSVVTIRPSHGPLTQMEDMPIYGIHKTDTHEFAC